MLWAGLLGTVGAHVRAPLPLSPLPGAPGQGARRRHRVRAAAAGSVGIVDAAVLASCGIRLLSKVFWPKLLQNT